jgi:hypothetical protein
VNTYKNSLIAFLTLSAAILAASSATAGGFSFSGGGNGGNKGSVKISFNGNHHHNNHHHGHHHHAHHGHHHHVRYYAPPVRLLYSKCYHPQFQCCYVYPGDTWYSISRRNYGVNFLTTRIASFNGLSTNSRLVPGQQLRLPVVNANGSLAVSNAPMPAPFAAQGVPVAKQVVPQEPTLPRVAIGSTLMLDGESLGTEKGIVRLQINGMTVPVEVIEWTAGTVKAQLPKMELTRAVKAELEVLRADGSVASNSAIELTPAETRVALGN